MTKSQRFGINYYYNLGIGSLPCFPFVLQTSEASKGRRGILERKLNFVPAAPKNYAGELKLCMVKEIYLHYHCLRWRFNLGLIHDFLVFQEYLLQGICSEVPKNYVVSYKQTLASV